MIWEVPQSGPGFWNAKALAYGPGLVKIKNIGTGQVTVGTDAIAVAKGNSGYPLAPGESWEQQYPTAGVLYAMGPNTGGGLIDVEIIPIRDSTPAIVQVPHSDSLLDRLRALFVPVIRLTVFAALLCSLNSIALAADIHKVCNAPQYGPCVLVSKDLWANANKVWVLPVVPGQSLTVFLTNYNPSSSHALTMQLYHTPDPLVADYSSNAASWTLDIVTCPASLTAAQTQTCVATIPLAAQFAISVTGASAQAGSPDTFSIFVESYATSALNLLGRNNVWQKGQTFLRPIVICPVSCSSSDIAISWGPGQAWGGAISASTYYSFNGGSQNSNVVGFFNGSSMEWTGGAFHGIGCDSCALTDGASGHYTLNGHAQMFGNIAWGGTTASGTLNGGTYAGQTIDDTSSNQIFVNDGFITRTRFQTDSFVEGGVVVLSNFDDTFVWDGVACWQQFLGGTFVNNSSCFSDRRFKINVQPVGNALQRIMQLSPVTFNYSAPKNTIFDLPTANRNTSQRAGFIAQDVFQVLPVAAQGDPNSTVDAKGAFQPMSLDYNALLSYTVSALQELATRVAALEAKQAQPVSIPARFSGWLRALW